MLDPRPFNNSTAIREIIRATIKTNSGAYLNSDRPVIFTSCQRVSSEWKDNQLPGWNKDWMVDKLSTTWQAECTSFDDRPTLIIQRNGLIANLFHQTEAFFNAFLALLIAGLRPADVRVLIADLYPLGPFGPLWAHLFGDVKTAWDIKDDQPKCYRSLMVGIYGPASPLTLNNRATRCFRSPLVRAYARWVWASFRLDPDAGAPARGAPARLLWVSRRSSVVDPKRGFCDGRYFLCADWAHLGVRRLERVLRNEGDVVAALRASPALNATAADFNVMPFEAQLRAAAAADILAGPHGAGLTHLLFLRDGACVFEVFVDGTSGRRHYANMAAWRGLRYGAVAPPNPADASALARRLLAACPPAI